MVGNGLANRLFGGAGNDSLTGGAGDDVMNGGGDVDTALFTGAVATSVNLSLTTAQDTGHGNDTLVGIENVTSGSARDKLVGNDLANTLIGNGGNDQLEGGLGDDVLNGGDGRDTAVFRGTIDSIIRLTKSDAQNTGHGQDTLIGIENVFTGGGDDKLTGTNAANTFRSGGGDDRMVGGAGNDVLNGGGGKDTAVFNDTTDARVDLNVTTRQNTGHGNDRLIGIENLASGSGNDKLTGNDKNNILTSNRGNDVLDGGGRNDRLEGGRGNDSYTGGTGRDTFVFAGNDDRDRVEDFENGRDKFEITSGATTFADIRVVDKGSDTLLTFGTTRVILKTTEHTDIDASDFLFT